MEAVYLYDHLLVMKERSDRVEAIKKLTVSDIAHIVLEARQAFIRKVEELVGESHSKVLFILGRTGVGKTTALIAMSGHKVSLQKNSYVSEDKERNQLISPNIDTSCTFFPNSEMVQDTLVIDFPGFNDTHGLLLSLAIESALKWLLVAFKPQVLFLETLPDIAGRCDVADQQKALLTRLLDSTENVLLGITGYSRNVTFKDLKKIEGEQLEALRQPSDAEKRLTVRIECLEEFKGSKKQIAQMQAELKKMKDERLNKLKEPLPETNEQIELRNEIQKNEQALRNHIGLNRSIQLFNLEDPKYLQSILEEISRLQPVAQSQLKPDLEDKIKNIIIKRLKNDLRGKILLMKPNEGCDASLFEQKVRETSLTSVVSSESNPEIGQFLHLPGMDPQIVADFDKEFARDYIRYMVAIAVYKVDIFSQLMEKKFSNPHEQAKEIQEIKEKIEILKKDIIEIKFPEEEKIQSQEQMAKKWKEVLSRNQPAIEELELKIEKYSQSYNSIEKFLKYNPLTTIPFLIYDSFRYYREQQTVKAEMAIIDRDNLKEIIGELNRAHESIMKWKEIEIFLLQKDSINQEFIGTKLDLGSTSSLLRSLSQRIKNVRAICDSSYWNTRLFDLKKQLKDFFSDVRRKSMFAACKNSKKELSSFFGIAIPFSLMLYLEQDSTYDFIQLDPNSECLLDVLEDFGKTLLINSAHNSTFYLFKRHDSTSRLELQGSTENNNIKRLIKKRCAAQARDEIKSKQPKYELIFNKIQETGNEKLLDSQIVSIREMGFSSELSGELWPLLVKNLGVELNQPNHCFAEVVEELQFVEWHQVRSEENAKEEEPIDHPDTLVKEFLVDWLRLMDKKYTQRCGNVNSFPSMSMTNLHDLAQYRFLANLSVSNLSEVNPTRVPQPSLPDKWYSIDVVLQEFDKHLKKLDMNLSVPISKALLGAVILDEFTDMFQTYTESSSSQ